MRNRTRHAISSFSLHRVQYALSTLFCVGLAILVFVTACGQTPPQGAKSLSSDGWHEFQGTWTAAGSRNRLHLTENRWASISTYEGSLLLSGPSRPGVGFRSEAIVFNDSATGLIGRAVWTDEHGEQVVSELQGGGTAENNKIIGIFVGGTGRYAGASGTYEFSWRFVIENEDGIVQGQSINLHGRVRVDSPHVASIPRGPQS
jgi:hypothetical protein